MRSRAGRASHHIHPGRRAAQNLDLDLEGSRISTRAAYEILISRGRLPPDPFQGDSKIRISRARRL